MSEHENDWIFDYVLQFLESDKFDASIMDFVDEKCFVFDSEEENKFIYTDIHSEFREHIEALISSNLGELGITSELFFEACEKGRNGRDVNRAVFERMVAMDEFNTFKKIMVKRNIELQLEAMQTYSYASSRWPGDADDEDEEKYLEAALEASLQEQLAPLPDPEDLQLNKEAEISKLISSEGLNDGKVQDILRQSLMEMELMHRQEELEQAELEQAVAISLALEDERLRLLYAEAVGDEAVDDISGSSISIDAKQSSADAKSAGDTSSSSKGGDDDGTAPSKGVDMSDKRDDSGSDSKRSRGIIKQISAPALNSSAFPDPKPLSMGKQLMMSSAKALPPIGGGRAPVDLAEVTNELEDKRRQAEEALRRGQSQLASQRSQEEELRKQISQADPDEAERRARQMREQRDRLVAMKKAEREKKVQAEEEARRKAGADQDIPEAVRRAQAQAQLDAKRSEPGDGDSKESEKEQEMKRAAMRMALARRMKMDLIESEEVKLAQMQEEQFADLDRKLRQVEQLRSDNKKREDVLAEQLRRQQANIARNVQRSAAALREQDP